MQFQQEQDTHFQTKQYNSSPSTDLLEFCEHKFIYRYTHFLGGSVLKTEHFYFWQLMLYFIS